MGFFENLGRKVGEFTHEAKQAADEEATYACTDCGERFYAARDDCPACGSDAIVEQRARSEEEVDGGDGDGDEDAETDSSPDST